MLPKDFRYESVNHNPPFITPLVFDDHFKAQMNLRGTRWRNPVFSVKLQVRVNHPKYSGLYEYNGLKKKVISIVYFS
jgi:hypothetical protein